MAPSLCACTAFKPASLIETPVCIYPSDGGPRVRIHLPPAQSLADHRFLSINWAPHFPANSLTPVQRCKAIKRRDEGEERSQIRL